MTTATHHGDRPIRRIQVFGTPALLAHDVPVPLSRRGRAMLSYLELAPNRRARRERLCDLLWPDRGESQARASLRQCLAETRAAAADIIDADREWIRLEPGTLPSDYAALDAAIGAGDAARLRDVLTALTNEPLVHGLNVSNVFDEWVATARAATERRLGEAVASAMAGAVAARDWAGALGLADAWLARDPLDERVAALAIRAERLRAAPAAAQRRARVLAQALAREDLGAPGPAVVAALDGPLDEPPDLPRFDSPAVALARGTGLSLPPKPSIAVLPFLELSGDDASQAFADGMVEELSVALSRFSSLFVIAGQSSLSYRGTGKPAQAIATELGVRYLLEGSVRQAGGRVRISVKLVDAAQGQQIWADRFDGEPGDIFALQDRVAGEVASRIDSTITDAEMQRAAARQVPAPDAYELNLRANARLNIYTRQSIEEALALAEAAVQLDPEYAWAVAIAGFCHAALLMNGWAADPVETRAKAEAHVEHAIRIGADDLMALPVTAGAILNMGGDQARARRLLDRALELNPEKAFTLFWSAWLELLSDRCELALGQFEKALRLNPRSAYRPFQLTGMGSCLFALGRFEEAAIVLQEAVNLVPAYAPAHMVLAGALARLGRLDEARLARRRAEACSGSRDMAAFGARSQRRLLHQALALLDTPDEGDAAAGIVTPMKA